VHKNVISLFLIADLIENRPKYWNISSMPLPIRIAKALKKRADNETEFYNTFEIKPTSFFFFFLKSKSMNVNTLLELHPLTKTPCNTKKEKQPYSD